jgi:hypothetical protein
MASQSRRIVRPHSQGWQRTRQMAAIGKDQRANRRHEADASAPDDLPKASSVRSHITAFRLIEMPNSNVDFDGLRALPDHQFGPVTSRD